ncbi:MAG: hypothetical protein HZA46_24095 [Planctomycetales bacterium]|nr:hypothetical protein [Planctomycetales bacterium]
MTIRGKVQGGVVVMDHGVSLPDGTDVMILTSSESPSPRDGRPIWKKLADLGHSVESQPTDLPPDLAGNHDHYLHGLPKRT